MKKIIILTSKGGEGLISGSKAIAEGLRDCFGNEVEVAIIDFFEEFGSVGKPFTNFYNLLLKKSLWMNTLYVKLLHSLRVDKWSFLNRRVRPKFEAFLEKESPDALVITSQYIVSFISSYKEKERMKPTVFVGNMDPGTSCVSLWFGKNVDKHLIPTPECLIAYQQRGYDLDRAVQTKLVVRKQFKDVVKLSKHSLRKKYSLSPSGFIVLFTGSREGLEEFYPLIQQVLRDTAVHCLVICGCNEKLTSKLMSLPQERLTVVGWTDTMHEYLQASDIVVSKPGKQTMKETITTQTPMISLCYPGVMDQERGNLEYMNNRGVLIKGRSREEIIGHIQEISQNPEQYNNYVERLKGISSQIDSSHVARAIWQELDN